MTERRAKARREDDKFAYYPWYPRDYESDGPVKLMTLEEEGAYRRLLDYQWLNGSVPAEIALLAKICKNISPARMRKLWPAIQGQFPGGKNGRLEVERQEVFAKSAHAKAAADARWNPIPEPCPPDAPASLEHTTEHMPDTCYPKAKANTKAETTKDHTARDALETHDPGSLTAYDALRRSCRNPLAFDAELAAIAAGSRNIQPAPTWQGIGLALQQMHLNGDPPKGALLSKYVARSMADLQNGVQVVSRQAQGTWSPPEAT